MTKYNLQTTVNGRCKSHQYFGNVKIVEAESIPISLPACKLNKTCTGPGPQTEMECEAKGELV